MFAPDSAYINQCERDPDYQETEWSYSLAMSHAVVDSIAAELAAALRHRLTDCHCDYAYMCPSHKALQRFDNLNNQNKEQQ